MRRVLGTFCALGNDKNGVSRGTPENLLPQPFRTQLLPVLILQGQAAFLCGNSAKGSHGLVLQANDLPVLLA